jgi:hypothetical protein
MLKLTSELTFIELKLLLDLQFHFAQKLAPENGALPLLNIPV